MKSFHRPTSYEALVAEGHKRGHLAYVFGIWDYVLRAKLRLKLIPLTYLNSSYSREY